MTTTATTNAPSLTYSKLLDVHRKNKNTWKWATERKINEEYGIPSGELAFFHDTYGLPRLKGNARGGLLYSQPALETILELVTDLHYTNPA